MNPPEILLVALPPTALELAQQALKLVFPHRNAVVLPDFIAARQSPITSGPQLLVLGDATSAVIAEASQAMDKNGLPRWAVVVMGAGESDVVETVPLAEWNPPLLARVFRATLLQQELLWENLRLRGDMKTVARRISHDLRTPVGCIYTTAAMLPELDAASLASLTDVIKQSSMEISQIIERVSFVLKASADPCLFGPVKMDAVVKQVLQELEPEINKTGAVVIPPGDWPEVTGVAPWLQVIWSNLLNNALQHGGPSPRITLEWERCDGFCRFSVTDSGAGVAATRRRALFSPFDQLHETHSTGMGLSIVQRLTFLQGGSCEYEEPTQGGARFHFTVPGVASGVN